MFVKQDSNLFKETMVFLIAIQLIKVYNASNLFKMISKRVFLNVQFVKLITL